MSVHSLLTPFANSLMHSNKKCCIVSGPNGGPITLKHTKVVRDARRVINLKVEPRGFHITTDVDFFL